MNVAWCTGAGRGIGRAVACLLAQQGWTVAVSSRSISDLESLKTQARSNSIHCFAVDIADEQSVLATVREIEETVGPISLAILNAGTHCPVTVNDFNTSTFHVLMNVNFHGTISCLAALLPYFKQRKSGTFAVVASVAGYVGLPSSAAYGATKAALINACEALKPDLECYGIRLQLINPGFVRTPLTDRNDFDMPFLMEVEPAAQRIVAGLSKRTFEITFPRRFTWGMKLLRILPYPIFFAITRRLLPNV